MSNGTAIWGKTLAPPAPLGSYAPGDVVFLLKDVSEARLERPTEDREEAIQSGVHYSEMLPVEYKPTAEYLRLFHETLAVSARKVALAAGIVAELIRRKRGDRTVLVSLARAGTPVGILIKRYLQSVRGLDWPHYSISIIRGKGIDENALLYMLQKEGADRPLQFVDGWTGKGAIRRVLVEACETFANRYGIRLSDDLAVLADPGCCSETYGTREDYLIPSACLNSTVSGLMSRTVLRPDLIGPDDYHGAKFYREWLGDDVSRLFVDTVASYFHEVAEEAAAAAEAHLRAKPAATWQGLADIRAIQAAYGIDDMNLIKPGVGETTRVLLRRVPWKILVDRPDNPNLAHIRLLAADRNVPVEVFPGLTYSCCGVIRPLKEDRE
ncbi:cysteine protease StiP family protein [Paenibacillus athensensis]|uniref:Uncharacterized protein n=1 Tax=Paenibacillus athensensis TaxID=1967502 RepID=A0A4Y8PXV3_9BACL|nr:cysteine protease StiP family protein [Paenibacillus athensensis]MCD1261476.1 cysteine protease StiP family protein [Paenibacillus athensensis]